MISEAVMKDIAMSILLLDYSLCGQLATRLEEHLSNPTEREVPSTG